MKSYYFTSLIFLLFFSVASNGQKLYAPYGIFYLGADTAEWNQSNFLPSMGFISKMDSGVWQYGRPQKDVFDSVGLALVTDTMLPYEINAHGEFVINIPIRRYPDLPAAFLEIQYNCETDSSDFLEIYWRISKSIKWYNLLHDTIPLDDGTHWHQGKYDKPIPSKISGTHLSHRKFIQLNHGNLYNDVSGLDVRDTIQLSFRFTSDSIDSKKAGIAFYDISYELRDVLSTKEHQSPNPHVLIYPNPINQTTLNIRKLSRYPSSNLFEVYSITGQLLKSVELIEEVTQIDVIDLSDGLKLFSLKNKDGFMIQQGKLMISH